MQKDTYSAKGDYLGQDAPKNAWEGRMDKVWNTDGWRERVGQTANVQHQTNGNGASYPVMIARPPAGSDDLREFIDQRCQRLESVLQAQIWAAMPAAAAYFLECQEAKQKGEAMPPPPQPSQAGSPVLAAGGAKGGATAEPKPARQPSGGARKLQRASSQEENFEDVVGGKNPRALTIIEEAQFEMIQIEKGDAAHSWYEQAFERISENKSHARKFAEALGLAKLLPKTRPSNWLTVHIADESWFHLISALAVGVNTVFSAYTADAGVRKMLEDPPVPEDELPGWWSMVDLIFVIFFCVELAIRLSAYRMWFFVAPGEWNWNLLDLFVVVISVVTQFLPNIDVDFLRTLRTFRVVRMARVVRVIRGFAELRKLLFAVLACVASLVWASVFLGMTIFLFSLFILQGIKATAPGLPESDLVGLRETFLGLDGCFTTLFSIVVGPDWHELHIILRQMGFLYALIMPVFVLFVNIGVMNIVIGVFADAAADNSDRDLIAQDEIGQVEDFVSSMLHLFKEALPEGDKMEFDDFTDFFHQENVQAYLSFHGVDASHARLIYKLCDLNDDRQVDLREFVLGLLRLKGDARHLDQRVMMHAIRALSQKLDTVNLALEQ